VTLPLEAVPGYGAFFRDWAAGRLPAALDTLRRPERAEDRARVLADRPPFALGVELSATLTVAHRRLGAPAAALANVARLAAGEALVVLTGQQPGLVGGPLYTRLKIGTAVALAESLQRTLGRPVVPIYWNAADDADFDEVAHGTLARGDFKLLRFSLPAAARVPRGWVGDLPGSAVVEALAPALGAGLGDRYDTWHSGMARRAAAMDFGDLHAAEALRWYGERGLVVVDARWPELRRAAAGLFAGYLEQAGRVRDAVVASGDAQRRAGYEPPIGTEAAAGALFLTPERSRLKLEPAEALAEAARLVTTHPSHLSPNVVLRPLVNDVVFPTIAHVAGPAEVQYLTQLVPVYEALGVARPLVADRALATLVPGVAEPVAIDLARGTEGGTLADGVAALLADPVEALRRWFEGRMPAGLAGRIAAARAGLSGAFEALREPSRELDASLVQILDSAREKALFQFERFPEGAYKKVRQREEAARPGLAGLAEFLKPRTRLQERELSALAVELAGAEDAFEAAVATHVAGLATGRRGHQHVAI
jgi:bacillithiol biosynthesis cysteine-adding enzyme BshC